MVYFSHKPVVDGPEENQNSKLTVKINISKKIMFHASLMRDGVSAHSTRPVVQY